MKTWRHMILYFVAFPWDVLVAYPVVLLIRLFWGKDLRWETPPYSKLEGGGPCLTCQIKEGSLPVRKGRFPVGWYLHKGSGLSWGGTTLGHGIFYGVIGRESDLESWSRTQAHEHVHVEQHEASMLMSFIVGLAVFIVLMVLGHHVVATVLGGTIWALGYLLLVVGGWLTALLRGEPAYRGSQHEESSYCQTDRLYQLSKDLTKE